MKTTINRIALVLTALCLMLTAFVGCTKTVEQSDDIAFTYFLPNNITVFDHGQTAFVQVVAVNEGNPIAYQGSSPADFISATLQIEQDGKTYRIEAVETPSTTDATEHIWERGESATRGFDFVIPADAPIGHYSLVVVTGKSTRTFDDVLEVHIHTEGSSHIPNSGSGDDHGHQH